MPNRGKFVKNTWKNQYIEHDYRGGTDKNRHVSFKPNRFGGKYERNHKDWGESVRAHLADEDIDMGATSGNVKSIPSKKFFRRKNVRSGSPMPHRNNMKRKLLEGPINWYRVTLPYGNKYDKQYILKTLLEKVSPLPLIPITWSVNGSACTFYVDDFKIAEKLNNLDREIQLPDGFRLVIRVNSGCPNVDITATVKDKMKLTMAKRYNAITKALDLTKFHADPDLQQVFCALFKPIILLAVVEIIAENIPEIEAINLQDNKLHMLAHLKKLSQKLPNLKILHMGNNKIKDVSQLDALIGLQIVDLVLDGNPLCDRFKDQTNYIRPLIAALGTPFFVYSEVRKRFPKVMKLDGIDLPPPISFDISEEVTFPPSLQTYLCNAEGQGIVSRFLEQYFSIMDSDNRRPLLEAYHEQAAFSMTMSYPYGQSQKNSNWLNWYGTDNRNLLRVSDTERRHKLLKQGQLAIVSFLQEMPSSKHDIGSFTADVNLFTPQMILLTVTGMFKEMRSAHKTPPVRYFFRTLVIVPAGTGFCIANEEVHITNATEDQIKMAFKTPPPAVAPDTSVTVPVVPVTADDQTKQQMVQAMSQQSGMNLEWSEKCLQDSQWDFQRAGFVFSQLHTQGKIPAEAFVK